MGTQIDLNINLNGIVDSLVNQLVNADGNKVFSVGVRFMEASTGYGSAGTKIYHYACTQQDVKEGDFGLVNVSGEIKLVKVIRKYAELTNQTTKIIRIIHLTADMQDWNSRQEAFTQYKNTYKNVLEERRRVLENNIRQKVDAALGGLGIGGSSTSVLTNLWDQFKF